MGSVGPDTDAMMAEPSDPHAEQIRRIPARVPARVDGLASLRTVTQCMMESGVRAVLVESPLGPVGLVTANDVIDAIAGGADPDTVWAGEITRPSPRIVSSQEHPAAVAEQMAAYEIEIVAVADEDAPLALASALDVLGAVLRAGREGAQSP